MSLVDRKGRIAAAIDVFVRGIVKTQLAPVVLALPLFAFEESWIPWGGVRTPDVGLLPKNAAACVAFATAFGFGWLRDSGSSCSRLALAGNAFSVQHPADEGVAHQELVAREHERHRMASMMPDAIIMRDTRKPTQP